MKDYFDNYDELPENVREALEPIFNANVVVGDYDRVLAKLKELCWTMEYNPMDGYYDLRPTKKRLETANCWYEVAEALIDKNTFYIARHSKLTGEYRGQEILTEIESIEDIGISEVHDLFYE